MWTHLSYKHPGVNAKNSGDKSGAASFFKGKQATLRDFTTKVTPLSDAQQESITKKLAMLCALDLKPFSLVEGAGFRAFCEALNSRYKVPSRKTVSKYLESIYEEEKLKLVDKVKELPVSATTDLWTSNCMQGYITLTGHFVSSDWKLCSHVFATRVVEERHTGTNIASEISKIIQEFGVSELVAIATDNASNMGIACKELGVFQVSCFAHTLQLAISDGLKLPQIARTLGAARKLVCHFSHSLMATKALLDKQTEGTKLKLVQDVSTRWNSSYQMLERLLRLRIPVYGVIFDENITKPADRNILDIRDSFWQVIENICPVLEPLAELTELLGKEDTPTGSSVLVILHDLVNNVLKSCDSDSGVVKDLKLKVRSGLIKRFQIDQNGIPVDEMLSSPLMLSTLLDPRYKNLITRDILSSSQGEKLHDIIVDQMASSSPQVSENSQSENAATAEPPCKISRFWNILHGDSVNNSTILSPSDELKHYLDESVTVTKPLEWWKIHEAKFPRLSKLAKKISICASNIYQL